MIALKKDGQCPSLFFQVAVLKIVDIPGDVPPLFRKGNETT